jgi:probable H4MPT-linked C1 transfer pathway protein
MPSGDGIVVTMTAELCDCFETKANGVRAVLDAVESALRGLRRKLPVRVWLTNGLLVSPTEARAEPLKAAASNWLALATWAGRFCAEGPALLLDIGSTTTDITPLRDGVPVPRARTDIDRLACGELVYSGTKRTPVNALVRSVSMGDRTIRVAAELFATTRDVYLWLGDLPEQPDDCDTADGRPATREYAAARLARVVCADRTMLDDDAITQVARQAADAQRADLVAAMTQVETSLGQRARTVVTVGSGEFLGRRIVERLHKPPRLVSIAEVHGPETSSAACAYALAVIASERGLE